MTRHRILKATLILVIGVAFLLAIGGPIAANILTKRIKEKLEAAHIHIGDLHVNLFTRSITLTEVEWEKKVKIRNMYASGIRLLPLMREKRISIRRLGVEGGTVDILRDSTHHKDQPDSISISIKGIDVDRITINDVAITVKRDTVTEYKGKVDLVLHYVALDSMPGLQNASSYTFKNIETTIRDLHIRLPNALYALTLKEITFDQEMKRLHLDSLELQPIPSTADWGKVVKSQETRVTVKIGKLDATGVTMGIHLNDTTIMATSLTMDGWDIYAYKNKKYPFTRTKKFPLPMESFRAIGLGLEIDTLKLHKGKVTYEELPTEGFHNSWISFENIEATMNPVNNRTYENLSDYSTLQATGRIMKSGEVKAVFKLPLDPKKKYTAEGIITNVPMSELNPLLKDIAFVEITSGKLNKMLFQFEYDDEGSKGELHFDYEDLKILSLKKDPIRDINAFKTMLVNTAVKNDKTLNGNINVKRFKRKAVFHLWTMSLLDGIKDAIIPTAVNPNRKGKSKK